MLAAERDLWIPFGFQTPIFISQFRFLEEVLARPEGREGREEEEEGAFLFAIS